LPVQTPRAELQRAFPHLFDSMPTSSEAHRAVVSKRHYLSPQFSIDSPELISLALLYMHGIAGIPTIIDTVARSRPALLLYAAFQ